MTERGGEGNERWPDRVEHGHAESWYDTWGSSVRLDRPHQVEEHLPCAGCVRANTNRRCRIIGVDDDLESVLSIILDVPANDQVVERDCVRLGDILYCRELLHDEVLWRMLLAPVPGFCGDFVHGAVASTDIDAVGSLRQRLLHEAWCRRGHGDRERRD